MRASSLNEKLSDPENFPIEELLDEEDILSELKNQKLYSKFYTYFDTQKMKKLIDIALKDPSNPYNIPDNILSEDGCASTYKKEYKYPYICSEILSSEINFLVDKFFTVPDMLLIEETKSSLLNLSGNDSFTLVKKDEGMDDVCILDEIKKENIFFNPPEIEYSNDKDKFIEKDASFNTSLDKKLTMQSDNLELVDYIFSYLSQGNIEMSMIQGLYFSKIIVSFFKNKGTVLVKYVCMKRPDILLNLINNIHIRYICEIIVKILLIDNAALEDSSAIDAMKLQMITRIIGLYSKQSTQIDEAYYGNITFIFLEYIENNKNVDIFFNESVVTILAQQLIACKNPIALKEALALSIQLLLQFKSEFEKAQKFVCSMSKSQVKLLDKTGLLYLEADNCIISKFSHSLENILEQFAHKPTQLGTLKVTIYEFIHTFLLLTRNNVIYTALSKFNFFEHSWNYFFQFHSHDIFHHIHKKCVILILEEGNETWLQSYLLNGKILENIFIWGDVKNENMYHIFPNGKKCYKGFYIHLVKIFHVGINHMELNATSTSKKLLQELGKHDEFVAFYENNFKSYVEKMNFALGNYKSTQLYLSTVENNEDFGKKIEDIEEINKKIELDIEDINKKMDAEFTDDDNEDEFLIIKNESPNLKYEESPDLWYFDNNFWKVNFEFSNMDLSDL